MATGDIKVLIAEDEKPIAKALALKLSREGMDVTVVGNGAEALKELETSEFSVLLCDLVMPQVDGFAVLEQMKAKSIATPVVILSNLSQEEDRKKSLALGAKDFFIKSNTPIADIVAYVKKLLA